MITADGDLIIITTTAIIENFNMLCRHKRVRGSYLQYPRKVCNDNYDKSGMIKSFDVYVFV